MRIEKGNYELVARPGGTSVLVDEEIVKQGRKEVINLIPIIIERHGFIELPDTTRLVYYDLLVIFDLSTKEKLRTSKDRSQKLVYEMIKNANAAFMQINNVWRVGKKPIMMYDVCGKEFAVEIDVPLKVFGKKNVINLIETKNTMY